MQVNAVNWIIIKYSVTQNPVHARHSLSSLFFKRSMRLSHWDSGGMTVLYLTGIIVFTDIVLVDEPVSPLNNGKLWS